MTIYYVVLANGKTVGCRIQEKIKTLHPEYEVQECDIVDFNGTLYSNNKVW